MIDHILENGEKIVWKGKQHMASTIITSVISATVIFLVALLFGTVFGSGGGECTVNGQVAAAEECARFGKMVIWGGGVMFFFIIGGAVVNAWVNEYAITTKRIIMKSGLIGTDMRSVYYDQVKSIFVDVGLTGKIFGTGNVNLDTGRITHTDGGSKPEYDTMTNIHAPYDVYKVLQDTLSSHKEGMHSGRLDYTENREEYKDFVQETEKMKREV
jgi:uncharacterized membrane protein YdbT with pleckstrin-like domain